MRVIPVTAQASPAAHQGASTADQTRLSRALSTLSVGEPPADPSGAIDPQAALEAAKAKLEDSSPKDPSEAHVEAANAANEASAEEPKALPVKEDPTQASKYAQLARKEKATLARIQEMKSQEAALAAREAALAAREADMTSSGRYIPKERLTKDTLAVLSEQGITYEQLAQKALETSPTPEVQMINALKAEIDALKASQEQSTKSYQESQEASYKQAVAQITKDVSQLVNSDPEFETIKSTGQVSEVVKLIEETFKQDGVLMSVEEAAKLVEEEITNELLKHASLSKIQKRLQQASQKNQTPAKTPGESAKQTQQQNPPIKTLTNQMAVARQLSAQERALKAFKGEQF